VRKSLTWLIALIFLLAAFSACQSREEAIQETTEMVALYADRGVWPQSVTAAERMFQWMGWASERIDAQDIKNGALANFRLLCVPGGNMYTYAEDLGSTGVDSIKAFIRAGGGYVGICGGAYFAAQRVFWRGDRLPMLSLGLFPGEARGPHDEIAPYPDSAMCLVTISEVAHSIIGAQPDSAWILYYWGPALLADDDADVTVLGRYRANGQPAMLSLEFGRGRAFLSGVHPEIEEDSDRDGVVDCDELEDRGTDWELMKKMVQWCLGQ
jgi:glutamine amidotransferase-like uncharacterized protein